jgi:hypothetical protein
MLSWRISSGKSGAAGAVFPNPASKLNRRAEIFDPSPVNAEADSAIFVVDTCPSGNPGHELHTTVPEHHRVRARPEQIPNCSLTV